MLGLLDSVEAFCKAHEHTIGAVEAFSTLSAVMVSLVLAHRATVADRTRLDATVQISTIFHPTISPNPRFVVVTLTNRGNLPLRVPLGFFSWRVPLSGRKWVILPIDSAGIAGVIPQKTYPVEITPRSSETFFMSEASEFLKQMAGIKKEQTRIGRLLFWARKGIAVSADGRKFRAKGDRGITALAGQVDIGR